MKLSQPVYRLKRKARLLARAQDLPLHQALDRVAAAEGFRSWSLLAARAGGDDTVADLFARLSPGELVIVAARPGHGKTLLSLALAVEAMKKGNRAVFFTLEYTEREVRDRFVSADGDWAGLAHLFDFDCSDAISAGYCMEKLATAPAGTLAVIDYLQLLDQKRDKPELAAQVRAFKAFARERGLIIVFVSQVDRSYDPAAKPWPDLADIRLPNPLDLALFDKACFVNRGEVRLQAAG